MYCHACGIQIPDDSKFCTGCGCGVVATPQAQATAERWFVSRNGRMLGPFSLDEVRRYHAENRLSSGDQVWSDASPSWRKLGDVLGQQASSPPLERTPSPSPPGPGMGKALSPARPDPAPTGTVGASAGGPERWLVKVDGQVLGPFSVKRSELKQMLQDGTLRLGDGIRRESDAEWRKIQDLLPAVVAASQEKPADRVPDSAVPPPKFASLGRRRSVSASTWIGLTVGVGVIAIMIFATLASSVKNPLPSGAFPQGGAAGSMRKEGAASRVYRVGDAITYQDAGCRVVFSAKRVSYPGSLGIVNVLFVVSELGDGSWGCLKELMDSSRWELRAASGAKYECLQVDSFNISQLPYSYFAVFRDVSPSDVRTGRLQCAGSGNVAPLVISLEGRVETQ